MVQWKPTEWLSETWKGWSDQMPNNDVINRSPVWHSGLPFIHSLIHSSTPQPHPGVCCQSHPTTRPTTGQQAGESPPASSSRGHATVALKNSACGFSEISHNTLTLAHTLLVSTHPSLEKSPKPFTSSSSSSSSTSSSSALRYTSPLPLPCFYKVKHSREEGKNTWSS